MQPDRSKAIPKSHVCPLFAYQATETMVSKELEFPWELHDGKEKAEGCCQFEGDLSPGKRFQTPVRSPPRGDWNLDSNGQRGHTLMV